MVVIFNLAQQVEDIGKTAQELGGKLQMQLVEDKLMHSVLQSDKKTIEHAEIMQEAANQNVGMFTPDMMYSQMVKNFASAEQILGEKLVRLLTGYDSGYVGRNIQIPEFQKHLLERIKEKISELQDEGLLDEEGAITEKGTQLGSVILLKNLDNYITRDSTGKKKSKVSAHYGERAHTRDYRKGDRYKDVDIPHTVRKAIRRLHSKIHEQDLVTSEREGKGTISIIYALDASSSMKGEKIESCKKAGLALAHKAIEDKDKVGLLVFGTDVKEAIEPTTDFSILLKTISRIRASKQTDFTEMLRKAIEMFPASATTKHLVVLTDAMPTVGKKPEEETLKAASMARAAGITISIIGISLNKQGMKLANQLTMIGEGRLTMVKKLDNLGNIVLEDYYSFR